MASVTYFPELYIFSFILLIIYTTAAAAFEHYRFHYLHESGLAMILGVIVGVIFYFYNGGQYTLTFDEKTFFYFMLPPIIFAAGYNLKRRNFFKNFAYIFIFGILGTFITFFVIFFLAYAVSESDWIYIQSSPNKERNQKVIHLSIEDCLYFAATLCATDTVASLTILKPKKFPKLFSVIFGESTLNDAVAIILFQAIDMISSNQGINVSPEMIGIIIGKFFEIGILSLMIGTTCAIVCTLLLKHAHFIKETPVFEISIIFFFGYLSYVICQNLDLSGILSLLICGIVLAHYAFYNISITSKLATGITFQTISHCVEGFLFIYIGLVCVFKESEWSISLIVAECFILFISRIANVLTISLIFSLFYKLCGKKWDLDIFELIILIFAGSIRGAVSFALILILTGENAAVLQISTYINLMSSTIFMGALMPHLLKFVLRYRDRVYPERAFSNENQLSELMQERTTSLLPHKHNIPYKKGNILHSKWRNLDDNYLKPFLIYNYEGVKSEMECQRRLSVADIYRVEVNNEGGLDLRNPLPYSIREIDISMRADKNKKKNRRTIGLEGDMNDSLEEEILKGGKSDFDISYDMEGEKKFLDNGSFKIKKSVKYENEMENLSKNLIREKIRNKMLLKGKKKGGNNKSRKIKKNTNQNIEEEE